MKEILLGLAQLLKLCKEIKELILMGMNPLGELWLDNQDVSLRFHLSPRTLQTLRDNGTLPYSRINNKIYYKLSDILDLLQSNYYRNLKSRGKGDKKEDEEI